MERPLINIGFGGVVAKDKVVAIVAPGSLPIRKLRDKAKEKSKLINATQGRRTRAVIVTESDHVILSAIAVETIVQRVQGKRGKTAEKEP
ncbi:MAG: DUF370 domain-containing protein [bacterium]